MTTNATKPAGLRAQLWGAARLECAAECAAVAAAIAEQQSLHKELSDKCLLYGQAREMLEAMRRTHGEENPTPERLLFHAQTLANLQAIEQNPSVQHNAGRAVNSKFLAAEGIFQELEIAAEKSFDAQIAELVTAERAFFAGFGLPHESTAISRIAAEERAKIRAPHYRRTKEMLLNSPGGGVLAMLDISGLSELFQDQISGAR